MMAFGNYILFSFFHHIQNFYKEVENSHILYNSIPKSFFYEKHFL